MGILKGTALDHCSRRAITLPLPATHAAPGLARRYIRAALLGTAHAGLLDEAELLASELVTNAVRHGRGSPVLRIVLTDRLRLEISDDGPNVPCPRDADGDCTGGRGLWLVEEVARRWGFHREAGVKTVWCELNPTRAIG